MSLVSAVSVVSVGSFVFMSFVDAVDVKRGGWFDASVFSGGTSVLSLAVYASSLRRSVGTLVGVL